LLINVISPFVFVVVVDDVAGMTKVAKKTTQITVVVFSGTVAAKLFKTSSFFVDFVEKMYESLYMLMIF
jgi:hypothetical protein